MKIEIDFQCPHCQNIQGDYVVEKYEGRFVHRCETCRELFAVDYKTVTKAKTGKIDWKSEF